MNAILHERYAAAKLAQIAEDTMRRVRVALAAGAPVTEYDVIRAIRQAFDQAGLETEGTPSVLFRRVTAALESLSRDRKRLRPDPSRPAFARRSVGQGTGRNVC